MKTSNVDINQRDDITYGFYGRLKANFPSQIIVDATEVCNLACIHCAHPSFKKSEHYAARFLEPELNTKMVDEVKQYGQTSTQYIRYTSNGEPLLHKKIFEMLSYAVENSGVTVTLTTNGTLLDDNKIGLLLDTGIDVVDISIDAFTNETYSKVRVKGDLDITRSNVLNLLKQKNASNSKTKIVVSYIEQPQNINETTDFEEFWRDNGAEYVVVRKLHSNAGAIIPLAEIMRDSSSHNLRTPCRYPWERIILNPRGFLSFCPADWTHGSSISNADYRYVTIRDTWTGDFYQSLRNAHLHNEYTNHKFCGQCPDWVHIPWPNEGRSYADMIEDFKETE